MIPDFDRLRATHTTATPYPHVVVPNFLSGETLAAVSHDFPDIGMPGLFLPEAADYGPAFAELIATMESDAMRALVGDKLGVDLTGRPTLVTLRAQSQSKDGRIHADSKFKLATALLYLNTPRGPTGTDGWSADGGRLRILRSESDLEDYAAEVPPDGGLLVLFRVQDNSWHGHKPFIGPRRYLMVNWCESEALRDSEAARHRMSGCVKKAFRFFGSGASTDAA